jgi:very-short-patch-repair endonuclease
VDGTAHELGDNPARDIRRDAWLSAHGIRVLRIPAVDPYGVIEPAFLTILAACAGSE